jgi:hypothetical protein
LGIRSSDIPDSEKGKAEYSHPLAIIPGPSAPSNLRPFLQRTMQAFQKYKPGAQPFMVDEVKEVDGVGGACLPVWLPFCTA